MTNQGKKRTLAQVMTLALLAGTLPTAAFAAGEGLPVSAFGCTRTESCTLTDGHEGDCVPAPPANDGFVKTITGWTFVDAEHLNEGVLPLINVSMEQQEDFDTVVALLPTQISAEIEGEAELATLDIASWECAEYIPDGEGNWPLTGDYTFTAALPAGYACDPLPTVKALLGGANTYTANNTLTEGGLTVVASKGGEVEYNADVGFTLKASGTYKISGTWVSYNNPKAVITVPNSVTADVTLTNVTINVSGTGSASAFAVAAGGTANITLAEGSTNTLTSGEYRAGLEVPETAKVTIDGNGSLTATGGSFGAGIGGGSANGQGTADSAGTVIITSGMVTAKGGERGAGIGGGGHTSMGSGGSGGTIQISGNAQVKAVGGQMAAGIGGGGGHGIHGIGGNGGNGVSITISGSAQVTAMGGHQGGAGIGGGYGFEKGGDSGRIVIGGNAQVTATSSFGGAGIGGGAGDGSGGNHGGNGGDIVINGDTVVVANADNIENSIGGARGSSNSTDPVLTKGVVFQGGWSATGTVYGSPSLPGDLEIPNGSVFAIPSGSVLTIPDSVKLTNKGTIQNNGSINGAGTLDNASGTIEGVGSITGITLDGNKAARTITLPGAAQVGTASVTLKAADLSTGAGDGAVQYGYATSNDITAAGNWQTGLSFDGLSENTTYHFFAQVTGGVYYADAVSAGVSLTTGKSVYTVTVHGGTASPASASAGNAVTITATVPSGQRFTGWTGLDGLAITGGSAATEKVIFTMPDRAVEVTASFENIPIPTYIVTVNGGTASQASAEAGVSVTIQATAPSGQRFKAWTGLDGLTITEGSAVTEKVTFTMPARAVEVTASFENIPTGSGSSTPSFSERAISRIKNAKDGDTVKLDLPSNGKLPGQVLEAAAGRDITLEVSAGNGVTWIVNGKDIPTGKLSDLSLKVNAKANTIPVTVINTVTGAEKVMQLTLSHNGEFPFPLTLRLNAGKDNAGLFANLYYYNETAEELEYQSTAEIDADGNSHIPFTHASSYAVIIDKESHAPVVWENPFTDVGTTDWFYGAVEYVHQTGLMVGTTDTAFGPDRAVTRAQVWTVLARMDGREVSGGDPWYAPAQAWAVANGVSDGTDPDGAVSREQLVTMLYRYAQNVGLDVSVGGDTNLLSYDDALDVAEWAVPAFQWACGAGVVSGTGETTLSPRTGATRAQLAAILQRFSGGTV